MIKIHSTSMSVRVVNCDSSDTIIDAWKTSRPNVEINKDTLNEILKMDLPVNEMVHLTLDCKVPVIVREIITTLREHIMWARTSRVDNLLESWDIYDRALQDEDVKDIIEYKATQVENLSKETSQDNYRKYLPLAYMTEFTFKVSLRTLGKLINHMQWISRNYPSLVNICYDFTMALYAGLYRYYENMISGVSSELPKDYQAYREYFNNSLDNPKHINYNQYVPFDEENVTSDNNFMTINIKDIPIGLRAQLVRSRTMMIADNLLDAFEELGWKSDNTMTVNMSICSSKQFFLNMCSQRECFTKDVKVKLLDGKSYSFEELENKFGIGSYVDTYSVDENFHVVPSKSKILGKIRKSNGIYKITLDNGESIKCTPTHKFMKRDGSYEEAQNLKIMDSLMPIYTRISEDGLLKGYEQVFDVADNEWKFTHQISIKPKTEDDATNKRFYRHHVNFDKRDNRPDNLQWVSYYEHKKIHAEHVGELWKLNSYREKMSKYHSDRFRRLNSDPEFAHNRDERASINLRKLWKEDRDCILKRISENSRKRMNDEETKKDILSKTFLNPEVRKKSEITRHNKSVEFRDAIKKVLDTKSIEYYKDKVLTSSNFCEVIKLELKLSCDKRIIKSYLKDVLKFDLMKMSRYRRFHNKVTLEDCLLPYNHKIISIEYIDTIEDVYCLETDEYHNFLLDAGVVVSNCWLAQRDLWSPILDLIHQYLGDEVVLPCRSGKCPVYQDCIQRLIGKDPGVVCPMNYILHKDETIPMKVLDDKEIQKIQNYAKETKRCNALLKASESLKEVITKFKGE